MPNLSQLLIGLLSAGAIAFLSHRLHLLSNSGAWGTFVLGTIVFGCGGIPWSIPLITFFVLSSLLSKFSKRHARKQFDLVFEKGSTRDAGQVLANGGIAGAIVLANMIHPMPELYIAYLGALAAAAADTWGTEIGVMGRGVVYSVWGLQRVEPGTSGGISLVGTTGAVLGALSVAASGAFFTEHSSYSILIASAAGICGMLADSMIGATLQAQYHCRVCGVLEPRERSTAANRRALCGAEPG